MGNRSSQCLFCELLVQEAKIIDQSEEFFAFHDIDKGSAQEHVLVCTKQHIKTALQLQSAESVYRMRVFGERVLNKICSEKATEVRNYRFGFHLPPFYTVNHVHLHCFVEPFTSWQMENIHYGMLLHSAQDVIAKLRRRRHRK